LLAADTALSVRSLNLPGPETSAIVHHLVELALFTLVQIVLSSHDAQVCCGISHFTRDASDHGNTEDENGPPSVLQGPGLHNLDGLALVHRYSLLGHSSATTGHPSGDDDSAVPVSCACRCLVTAVTLRRRGQRHLKVRAQGPTLQRLPVTRTRVLREHSLAASSAYALESHALLLGSLGSGPLGGRLLLRRIILL